MGAPKEFGRQIAWVTESYEFDGKTETRIIRAGMTREEIIERFPPHWNSNLDFNRQQLIEAIIFEAYKEVEVEGIERDKGNIRSFWYERLMHTLIKVMGEPGDEKNIHSINTSINSAWKNLVEDSFVTYKRLNLYSEKERGYNIQVVEDSPYPTTIVVVEKERFFDDLSPLADTYQISFVALGGQSSRAAALDYLDQLSQIGADLSQDFLIVSFCDFDPEGWTIPIEFAKHLELGTTGGAIRLVRAGTLKEQLGDSVIELNATPYPIPAKGRERKAKLTKYANFEAETGGLYIEDSTGRVVPARVEMDIYSTRHVLAKIVEKLSEHLDGFEYQKRHFKDVIGSEYDAFWNDATSDVSNNVSEAYVPYFDAIENERQQLARERIERTAKEDRIIRELYQQIEALESRKEAKTQDISDKEYELRRVESHLDDVIENHKQRAIYSLAPEGVITPDGLAMQIEQNGGWRHWAEDVGIDIVSKDAFIKAGLDLSHFDPKVKRTSGIREWIEDRLDEYIYYQDYQPIISESPEELIREFYNQI